MSDDKKIEQAIVHTINKGRLVNRKFQIVEKLITAANSVIAISENIKQEYNEVKGLFVVCDNADVAKAATITLRHKGIEVLPEGFDLNLLTDRENVAMDDYTLPVQLEGKTAKIDGSISVGDVTILNPVSVKLYFVCTDDKTYKR